MVGTANWEKLAGDAKRFAVHEIPQMPHAMRILPSGSCPHCGSGSGTVRDEWSHSTCRDCCLPHESLAEVVARDRAAYGGGMKGAL